MGTAAFATLTPFAPIQVGSPGSLMRTENAERLSNLHGPLSPSGKVRRYVEEAHSAVGTVSGPVRSAIVAEAFFRGRPSLRGRGAVAALVG